MAKQRDRVCGTKKCKETPISDLPGCDVYSIRTRPSSFPPYDINYYDWDVVGYNIEKKNERIQLTAYGQTKEEAVHAMQTILNVASVYRIDTYNGVPGSGLVKTDKNNKVIIDPKEIKIAVPKKTKTTKKAGAKEEPEEDVFYKIRVSVGPWKPKKNKVHGGANNNCGRQQIHQEMRKVLISIVQERSRE